MREKGWIEGKNLLVEYRFAETPDRMATLTAELVALTPDRVIALGPSPALALKSATATVPIVAWLSPIPWGSASSKASRVQAVTSPVLRAGCREIGPPNKYNSSRNWLLAR
ncbi:hypothetical protein ACVW1A_006792 [Bradyrhizobium sp. LB1.3]